MTYSNKELARMTLDAINNPNNIYHEGCLFGVQFLMQSFSLSYDETIEKIKSIAKDD